MILYQQYSLFFVTHYCIAFGQPQVYIVVLGVMLHVIQLKTIVTLEFTLENDIHCRSIILKYSE